MGRWVVIIRVFYYSSVAIDHVYCATEVAANAIAEAMNMSGTTRAEVFRTGSDGC